MSAYHGVPAGQRVPHSFIKRRRIQILAE